MGSITRSALETRTLPTEVDGAFAGPAGFVDFTASVEREAVVANEDFLRMGWGCSWRMSWGGLSLRRPLNTAWRMRPSRVHSANATSAISSGFTQ